MEHGEEIARARGGRHLKTAAEALTALRLLGTRPGGLTADALATALGKSTATARYLINTLCQEGYAQRDGRAGTVRLTALPPWGDPWGDPWNEVDTTAPPPLTPDHAGPAVAAPARTAPARTVPSRLTATRTTPVTGPHAVAARATPTTARSTPGPTHRPGGDHPSHPRGRAAPPRPPAPPRREAAARRHRHPLGSIEEER